MRRLLIVNLSWIALSLTACSSDESPGASPGVATDAGSDASPDVVLSDGQTSADAEDALGETVADGDAAPVAPPFIMAHRGGATEVPENTLFGFARAIDNYVIPEMDVRLTQDGRIVVIHDATVDRTTDGSGDVAKMTLAEIKQLDAGSWFGAQYAGEKVPTLDEVFQLFSSTAPAGLFMSVDTKVENNAIYDGIILALGKHNLFDRVVFEVTSTQIGDDFRARPGGSAVKLAIWVSGDDSQLDQVLPYPHISRIHAKLALADRASDVHTAGKSLVVVVESSADWDKANVFPVDGINTNRPLFMKQVLGL